MIRPSNSAGRRGPSPQSVPVGLMSARIGEGYPYRRARSSAGCYISSGWYSDEFRQEVNTKAAPLGRARDEDGRERSCYEKVLRQPPVSLLQLVDWIRHSNLMVVDALSKVVTLPAK